MVTMRLMLRRTGLAGLAAMVGGGVAVITVAVPWHEVVATVDVLGATSSGTEARATGLDGWWGWVAAACGLAAVWLGAGLAFDRPVSRVRSGLSAIAAVLCACAVGAMLAPPHVRSVLGPDHAVDRIAELLPAGVTLEFAVRTSIGAWLTLVAAGIVGAAALADRDG